MKRLRKSFVKLQTPEYQISVEGPHLDTRIVDAAAEAVVNTWLQIQQETTLARQVWADDGGPDL